MTIRVMRSGVIDAPMDAVWYLLRDFNSHGTWHPAIDASRIEAGEPSDQVGAVRAFTLEDGSFLREQLIALSDRDMSLSYCLLDSPFPLQGYVARLQLRPVTDGDRCFLMWESSFNPPPEQASELARLVAENIYEAGIAALQARFSSPATQAASLSLSRDRPHTPSPGIAASRPMVSTSSAILPAAAIVVEQYGGPEVLQSVSISVPPPGPGEVRLRQTAIGVNFIDIYCRRGDFSLLQLPGVPGMEATGVVLDLGAGVADFAIGDRVAYAGPPIGAYAAIRNVPADLLVSIPPDIDDRTIAACYLKGVTVDFLLEDIHPLKGGETILLRAAAGGVGLIFSQAAKTAGATVIGVVSSEAKAVAARQAGCDHVLIQDGRDQASLLRQVQAITDGKGVDVVVDGGGGASFAESMDCLAVRGHLISLGQASGPIGPRDIDQLVVKSLTISRPNFAHYNQDWTTRQARAGRLFSLLRQGRIASRLAETFPLQAAAEAHRGLENRSNIGSYLLLP
jgi:NADPH:quinone reductase-like Zn-dependent oxidoreductase